MSNRRKNIIKYDLDVNDIKIIDEVHNDSDNGGRSSDSSSSGTSLKFGRKKDKVVPKKVT